MNSTFMGLTDHVIGQLYQRHNITVRDSGGQIVFQQGNFTYLAGDFTTYAPMWHYCYSVTLGFIPIAGEMYWMSITYEIFY